jgi:hypothetical protein
MDLPQKFFHSKIAIKGHFIYAEWQFYLFRKLNFRTQRRKKKEWRFPD